MPSASSFEHLARLVAALSSAKKKRETEWTFFFSRAPAASDGEHSDESEGDDGRWPTWGKRSHAPCRASQLFPFSASISVTTKHSSAMDAEHKLGLVARGRGRTHFDAIKKRGQRKTETISSCSC